MTCSVEGCEDPVKARGWCDRHYLKWLKRGDPLAGRTNLRKKDGITVCSIPGCGRSERLTRGWCGKHYGKWRRLGSPFAGVEYESRESDVCSVTGCGETFQAKGYCARHYQEVVARGCWPTVERQRSSLDRDDQGLKQCRICEAWLPESSFGRDQSLMDGLASSCKECANRRSQLQQHGLSSEQYAAVLQAQGGACLCGEATNLFIDHDHTCCPGVSGCRKCFRGLLCRHCNTALGFCRDDPAIMRRLAVYLEDWTEQKCA